MQQTPIARFAALAFSTLVLTPAVVPNVGLAQSPPVKTRMYGENSCGLLPAAAVTSITGMVITYIEGGTSSQPKSPGAPIRRYCQYYLKTSSGPHIQLKLNVFTPPTPQELHRVYLDSTLDSRSNCTQVSGLMDGGVLCTNRSASEPQRANLSVFEKNTELFSLTYDNDSDVNRPRAVVYKVAAAVLRNMHRSVTNSPGGFTVIDELVFQPIPKPAFRAALSPDPKIQQLKKDLWQRAESGDKYAQEALATLIRADTKNPAAPPADPAVAYWFQEAAKQGVTPALASIGIFYLNGWTVKKDEAEAARILTTAANQGSVSAMHALGLHYTQLGIKSYDFAKAYEWLDKAINAGDIGALTDRGVMEYVETRMKRQPDDDPAVLARQYGESITDYQKAAASGDCVAEMNLGGMYFNGDGVPQDKKIAAGLFNKARVCNGNLPGEFRARADRYALRAANGQLPEVEQQIVRKSEAPMRKLTTNEAIFLGAAAVLAAAVILDANSPPSTRDGDMRKAADVNHENDTWGWTRRASCQASMSGLYPNDPNPIECQGLDR